MKRSILYYAIFSDKFYKEKGADINHFYENTPAIEKKCKVLYQWYQDLESGKVLQRTEEQQKSEFLDKVFGVALGYKGTAKEWKLEKEFTFEDRSIADGLLGFFGVNQKPSIKVAIEIKKLDINLDKPQAQRKDNFTPVEQGFHYAYQAKETCKWIVVSNFDEVRLYHYTDQKRYESFLFSELFEPVSTTSKKMGDKYPLLKRFLYLLHYGQLFNNLASKDKGSQPATQQNYTHRLQRLEDITVRFYNDYKKYRQKLFLHLKSENSTLKLNDEDFFLLANKIFDRLIFMRFAQEVGITIPALLDNFYRGFYELPVHEPILWQGLKALFKSFDKGHSQKIPPFNGELFKPIAILDKLNIENEILGKIFQFLLSYDFKNELKVDVLGHIFENSLNSPLTPKGGKIKNPLSPLERGQGGEALRKQDGIFYTPEHITDFIIQKTVVRYLQEQKNLIYQSLAIDYISEFELDFERWQNQNSLLSREKALELYTDFYTQYKNTLENIKILDPACGSGAFLTRVFDYLLKENELVFREEEKFEQKVYEHFKPPTPKGSKELKRSKGTSMFNNKEAQENKYKKQLNVLARNIVLNNLFGTDINRESIEITKLSLWLKTANKYGVKLANLKNNIIQANSLAPPPNPLPKWRGGTRNFDVVVGNPPYFPLSTLNEEILEQYQKKFKTYERTGDIYCLFFEQALEFLKPEGMVGFITSRQWTSTNYGKKLRDFLVANANPIHFTDFAGVKVFKDATVDSSVLVIKNEDCKFELEACLLPHSFNLQEENLLAYVEKNTMLLTDLKADKWTIADDKVLKLKEKIRNAGSLLKDWNVKINYGIKTGLNEAFIIDEKTKEQLIKADPKSAEILQPVLRGRDVHQYYADWQNLYLVLTKNGVKIEDYPAVFEHLQGFGNRIKNRSDKGENWWNLRACSYYHLFAEEKIIYPETTVRRSEFYLDREGMYIDKTCFMMTGEHLSFLNGVLSSQLMEWFLEDELRPLGKRTLQYSKQYMLNVPLPKYESIDPKLYFKIVECSEKLTSLAKNLFVGTQTKANKQASLAYQKVTTDLDKAVFKLYGLIKPEINLLKI